MMRSHRYLWIMIACTRKNITYLRRPQKLYWLYWPIPRGMHFSTVLRITTDMLSSATRLISPRFEDVVYLVGWDICKKTIVFYGIRRWGNSFPDMVSGCSRRHWRNPEVDLSSIWLIVEYLSGLNNKTVYILNCILNAYLMDYHSL